MRVAGKHCQSVHESHIIDVKSEVQQKIFRPYTKCHNWQGHEGGLLC